MNEAWAKEKLENLFKSYNYTPKYQVDVMGRKIDVHVKYSDTRAVMAIFPAWVKNIRGFIGTERFQPVRISRERCLLCITIFDYKTCQIGAYKEIALSVPVLFDAHFAIPYLPLFFSNLFPNFGYYSILLAMTTNIARTHSERIFGYPTYDKEVNIDLNINDSRIFINAMESSEKILSMAIESESSPNQPQRTVSEKYRTYFTKENRLIEVQLDAFAYMANLICKQGFMLELGDHKISRMMRECLAGPYPLKCIHYDNATEILGVPKVIGVF